MSGSKRSSVVLNFFCPKRISARALTLDFWSVRSETHDKGVRVGTTALVRNLCQWFSETVRLRLMYRPRLDIYLSSTRGDTGLRGDAL